MKSGGIGSWTAPDGLGYSGLRPVRLSGTGYAILVLSAIFVIVGLGLGSFLWNKSHRERAEREQLEHGGARAQATVVRLWRSGENGSTRRMSYRFEVGGRVVTGTTGVPKTNWTALHTGDSVPVRYLPANPAVNHPEQWSRRVSPELLGLLIPLLFCGIASGFLLMVRCQSRLLSEGRPAPGVVVKARRSDKHVVVNYEFRLLSGAVRKGKSSCSGHNVPGLGSEVCVIYDPDNPKRNALYPLSLVKLLR
jgi:hypothetical protein